MDTLLELVEKACAEAVSMTGCASIALFGVETIGVIGALLKPQA
jgi:hypothetical protein